MKKLKLLDTFSGIGGFSYAAEKLVGGFETTQFIEIEPYCQKVLNKHWPNVPIHDDIRTFTAEPFQYDAVCGGFPCQDISTAGQGQGITQTTRSGLFYELLRVICMVRPKYFILENVSAILNNGLDIVLRDIYEAGYDAEWCCIPSSAVGACHQRDRWWLVGFPSDPDHYGSSSTKESRSTEETNGGSEERKNKALNLEGISKSRDSKSIQFDVTNTKSSDWNGNENKQRDGKPRTQKIFRNRDSNQSSHTWRFTKHRLKPNWRQYVSKPVLCRGDARLRNRVDRLKALGNSVVPQVAAIPLQRVKDIHKQLTSVDH